MQKSTFKKCIEGAWRDGRDLVCERPLFIALSIAWVFWIHLAQHGLRTYPIQHPVLFLFATGGLWIIEMLILNIVAVQAVRYVLLDRTIGSGFSGRDFWRYVGVTGGIWAFLSIFVIACFLLVATASRLLGLVGHVRTISATGGGAAAIAAIWVSTRLILLPSHAAIGRPLRWRAAWRDTRGHCISIFGIGMGIVLTLSVVALLISVLGALIAFAFHDGRHGPMMALVNAMVSVLGLVVATTGVGWIYRCFAVTLIEQSRAI